LLSSHHGLARITRAAVGVTETADGNDGVVRSGRNTCPNAGQVSRRHATNRNRTP
jgi:hypothetical protein